MIKGGYKLIDFKNKNLSTGTSVTIKGIYNSIEGSHRKPLIATGIVVDNVERNDEYVNIAVNAGNYEITITQGTISISSEDVVTFTANE